MEPDPETVAAWRMATEQAIADSEVSQAEVARRLGFASRQALPPRLGVAEPKPSFVFALEAAIDVEPGTLSHILGYVPTGWAAPMALAEIVAHDPDLTRKEKQNLLDFHAAMVRGRRKDQRLAEGTNDAP